MYVCVWKVVDLHFSRLRTHNRLRSFFHFRRHQSLHQLLDAIVKPEINSTSVLILGQKIGLQSKDNYMSVGSLLLHSACAMMTIFFSPQVDARYGHHQSPVLSFMSHAQESLRCHGRGRKCDYTCSNTCPIPSPSPSRDWDFLVRKPRLALLSLID